QGCCMTGEPTQKRALTEAKRRRLFKPESAESPMFLIDERKGRKIAQAHTLNPRGIVGLIKEFKLNEIIPEARPLFEECKRIRFWLDDKLIESVLREIGEF